MLVIAITLFVIINLTKKCIGKMLIIEATKMQFDL
jgi:hypothetical protein